MSVNLWKAVNTWGTGNNLTLDSSPNSVRNQTQHQAQVSDPADVPQVITTEVRIGGISGPKATVDSISGSDPYTIDFTCPRTLAQKFSNTGYVITYILNAETVESAATPYLPVVGQTFKDLVNPVNVAGTLGHNYAGSPAANGDQWVFDTNLTGDPSIVLNVDEEGYWILSSTPSVTSTANYYRIAADGTVDVVDTITFEVSGTNTAVFRRRRLEALQ